MFKLSKINNINLTKYNSKYHDKYEKIIFIEIPRVKDLIKILYFNFFKKRVSTILIVNETFLGRPRYMLRIPFLFNKVLINFNVNILHKDDENFIQNYSIINGITKCNKCFVD